MEVAIKSGQPISEVRALAADEFEALVEQTRRFYEERNDGR